MEEQVNKKVNDLARAMILAYLYKSESTQIGQPQCCYILLCQVLQQMISCCSYDDYMGLYLDAFKAVKIPAKMSEQPHEPS